MNTNYPYSHIQKVNSEDGTILCRIYQLVDPDKEYKVENLLGEGNERSLILKEVASGGHPQSFLEFSVPDNVIEDPIICLGTWGESHIEADKRRQRFHFSHFELQDEFKEIYYQPFVYLHNPDGPGGASILRLKIRTSHVAGFEVTYEEGEPYKIWLRETNGELNEFAYNFVIEPEEGWKTIEIEVMDSSGIKKGGGKVIFILSDPKPFDWLEMIKG